LAASEALAIKALSLAPENALGHLCLGVAQMYINRAAQGIAELERALALDRNLAAAHGYIGMVKCFAGRAEDTEVHIQEAFRLSPLDTLVYLWHSMAGVAKVLLGRNEEAVVRLRHSIETNRSFARSQFYLAAALAELGRLDEAQITVKEGLSIDPSFTIRRYRADAPSDNPCLS
jgi:tetratricopeptide (TPR) repeat protein